MIKKIKEKLLIKINDFRWFQPRPLSYDRFKSFSFLNIIFYIINSLFILINFLLHNIQKYFVIEIFYLFINFKNFINQIIDKNLITAKHFNRKDRCFILGNGPSLDQLDLAILKNEDVMVCNYFSILNDDLSKMTPKYYTLTNGSFLDEYDDHQFSKTGSKQISNKQLLKIIFEKTSKNTIFLFPSYAKKNFKRDIFFKNYNIKYFNLLPYPLEEKFPSKLSLSLGIPHSLNVLITNILISISLGYKEIYLLGADHNMYFGHQSFEGDKLQNSVIGKFMNINEKKNKFSFSAENDNWLEFLNMYKIFYSHELINKYARKNNIKIFNCSANSLLDTYDPKNINEIL